MFDRANLVFVFNFHPVKSFPDYPIGTKESGTYKIVLCSDDTQFGGQNRVDTTTQHSTQPEPFSDRPNKIMAYVPCRTAIIYSKGNT